LLYLRSRLSIYSYRSVVLRQRIG